ncbi:hypothetical protein NUW54_g9847 [Trametes sanguinea]|uniref:Uncharacterized protein n=1 Tax=Trametes sanguinea TaxID=158606 RepID=A0ACC1P4A8_9APHY|nr:hypothetical protein NUW54_g9847 [Trametes sanguinea]
MAGSIQVDKHTFETFCCLFSMGGDRRKLLRWNDFVQAMTRLNFKYSPQAGGGSGRVFEPTTLGVGRKLVWDEPHGRKRGRKGAFTRVTQAAEKAGHLVWLGQDDVCARLLQLSGAFALFSSRQEVRESGHAGGVAVYRYLAVRALAYTLTGRLGTSLHSAGDVLAPGRATGGRRAAERRALSGHSAGILLTRGHRSSAHLSSQSELLHPRLVAMSVQPITVPEDQVVLNLSMSYGPILVGAMLSCVTWGISSMQIFIYHMTYEDDGTAMKLFVFFVWLIDTANQVLLMASLWPAVDFVDGGLPRELVYHSTHASAPSLGLCRHRLRGPAVLPRPHLQAEHRKAEAVSHYYIVAALALSTGGYNPMGDPGVPGEPRVINAFDASSHRIGDSSSRQWHIRRCRDRHCDGLLPAWPASLNLLRQASRSILMTVCLCCSPICPPRRSKKMIHRLIVLTVVTGLWTAIAALVDFVLVAAIPQGLLFCIVELPFSSLYVNSLLANLNARQFLRTTDVELSSIEFYSSQGGTRGPANSTVLRSMSNSRGTSAEAG